MSYGQEEKPMFNTSEYLEAGATSKEMIRSESLSLVWMRAYSLDTHPKRRPTYATTWVE